MSAFPMTGVVRPYAWGSPTAIPDLLGIQPTGEPVAELWFGAHPDDPSDTPHGALDAHIAADPDGLLGADVVARFGPRLPFLTKLLAAGSALSLQVHPTLEQARERFAAGDPNYRDANHKPELIYALTPFDALCGFRPEAEAVALLEDLALAALRPARDLLAGGDVRGAFRALLELENPVATSHAVAAALPALPARWSATVRAVGLAAEDFPGDAGVSLALLLNPVRLQPGEALFLGAGNVHAYLRGLGLEVMANSDNVLRCGLTPKHIDVPELLRITDFSTLAEPRWPGRDDGFGPHFRVPVADFELQVVDLDAYKNSVAFGEQGPCLAICLGGSCEVDGVALTPGRAAFVPARPSAFCAAGSGRLAVVTAGRQI